MKLLLVIILGSFLSINCADDNNYQPNKRMKMSFICNKAEKNTDKKYECRFCGKCFSSKSYLPIHERAHTKEKLYKCNYEESGEVCGKAYAQITGLNYHKRTFHCKKMRITFICDEINKILDSNHECRFCGKYFQKSYLPIHERSHTQERPYICHWVDKSGEVCDKAYFRKSHLDEHQKIHTTGKKQQLVCGYKDESGNICDKSFTYKSNLNRHKKIHVKKPFVCSYKDESGKCNKAFQRKDHLIFHYQFYHK